MLPNDLSPWEAVYQQPRHWLDAGCFEEMVSDLCSTIRVVPGRQGQCGSPGQAHIAVKLREWPRTATKARSTVETARCIQYQPRGTCLLCMSSQLTNRRERKSPCSGRRCSKPLARRSDLPGSTKATSGSRHWDAATPMASICRLSNCQRLKKSFVLMPRCWVAVGSFGWLARFKRLSRDYERLPDVSCVDGMSLCPPCSFCQKLYDP